MPVSKVKFLIKLAGLITGIFALAFCVSFASAAITADHSVDVSATVGSVVPVITAISPSSVTAGGSAFIMDVFGSSFEAFAVATYNGGARTTAFIDSTHLKMNVTATDIATAGTANINVWDPGVALLSNTVVLTINAPSGGGGGGSTLPPNISGVQAIDITQTGARIIWNTDVGSSSLVEYGLTTSYGSSVTNGTMVFSHGLDLTGLTPNTAYHFRVTSVDQYGNTAVSTDYTFTTLAVVPLTISNVASTGIGDTAANITWDTNFSASSKVLFGTTPSLGQWATSLGNVLSHGVGLSGLLENTTYYYQVVSNDTSGNWATSTVYTFKTTTDTTPPTNITLTATPGDTVVLLQWTQPPETDFAGVRLMRRTGGYPTGPFDGTLVYQGLATNFLNTALTNGVTYYYAAYAYDTHANFASGALAFATPLGTITTPPTTTPPIVIPPVVTPVVSPVTPPGGTVTTTPPIPPVALPTTTVPSAVALGIHPLYYSAAGTIQLQAGPDGLYGVIGGSTVTVKVPTANLGTSISFVVINVNGNTYSLTPNADGTIFSGTFPAPANGQFSVDTRAIPATGTERTATDPFKIQLAGQVLEETIIPRTILLPDANVALEELKNGVWTAWNGKPFFESNPTRSSANGSFVFAVPNGTYRVSVQKDGFKPRVSDPFTVTHNVAGTQVSIIRLPEVSTLQANVRYSVVSALQVLRTQSVIQTVSLQAQVFLAASIVNAVAAASWFNLLAYLQYLFTQPILLFGRLRRKKWGTVYNSLTKQPVEFAIVRLVNHESHLTAQTMVTDMHGRYVFHVHKGNYILEAVKPGFGYPTQYLADKKQDVSFPDLYHGEVIAIEDENVIALNIPLDPINLDRTPAQVSLHKTLKNFQHALALLGVVSSLAAVAILPTTQYVILAFVQIGFYLLFRKLSLPAKATPWGMVYDVKTGKPLARAVVRIFDKKFNKLLETQYTDKYGRYGFFVGSNVFYVTVEKEGYGKYKGNDLDLVKRKETVVDLNVGLQQTKK